MGPGFDLELCFVVESLVCFRGLSFFGSSLNFVVRHVIFLKLGTHRMQILQSVW